MFSKLAINLSAVICLALVGSAQAAPTYAAACLSGLSDTNGDGWGWEDGRSCVITDAISSGSHLICRPATVDTNGDGWGYQRGASCLVIKSVNDSKPPATRRVSNSVCEFRSSDPDNDGWGFEDGASCVIDETSKLDIPEDTSGRDTVVLETPTSGKPICEFAVSDDNNDGWGYENGNSCRVSANSKPDTDTTDGEMINGKPVCASSLSDTDGDGFGFENRKTCVVAVKSRPFPVCLSLHSDFDGNGFGFENRKSCIVAEGVSHSRYDPLFATPMCDSWIELAYGNYRLENNTWNARVWTITIGRSAYGLILNTTDRLQVGRLIG